MSPVIWDNCRRADGSINLELAARHTGCHVTDRVVDYLRFVENIRPVKSRQVAALSIATAFALEGISAARGCEEDKA